MTSACACPLLSSLFDICMHHCFFGSFDPDISCSSLHIMYKSLAIFLFMYTDENG